MADAMVTGRMAEQKKYKGMSVLKRCGMSGSQAVNLMFDRLIQEGTADFLQPQTAPSGHDWKSAAAFVDGLSQKRSTRFDNMTKAQIKVDRLKSQGLM